MAKLQQKLLVANRGEIALRIIRTAKAMGIHCIAIYSPADALTPHVSAADESAALIPADDTDSHEAQLYLSIPLILSIGASYGATLLHPGYGFLSENAEFAQAVINAGIVWLGPQPEVIQSMGLKHLAKSIAQQAAVPCIPGSHGILPDIDSALLVSKSIGYPVIIKASAGGGGIGMAICENDDELIKSFHSVQKRAEISFHYDGIFLEKYFSKAKHIEIQIFGNGLGDIVCLGERECSIQRRHQKIIEETPSPFFQLFPELRKSMCQAAVSLGKAINYSSAGTVEFLVDVETAQFYFLEMNTRIQVEHPITEAIYPGLDLVKLMILQGLAKSLDINSREMQQPIYNELLENTKDNHALEVRLYAENPAEEFCPSPGILQHVSFPDSETYPWLRVESWILTGLTVTPFFDPLLAKIIVSASSRKEMIDRMLLILNNTHINGPPNNIEYLKAILHDQIFQDGFSTTQYLQNFSWTSCTLKIISSPIEITIQDFPGRDIHMGIPKSGPMDSLAFRAANILVGNSEGTEGLEMIIVPGIPAKIRFNAPAVIAVTGKSTQVMVDNKVVKMWSTLSIPAGRVLAIMAQPEQLGGLRTYLAIYGGFPNIPLYLGSKSTSMGLGGYQGRSLLAFDEINIANITDVAFKMLHISGDQIPNYPHETIVHVLSGPHDDPESYLTSSGIEQFYQTKWYIGTASNRLGIRLESNLKFDWAHTSGGAGGSHPSNILDNGYALGSINLNGNTPVILTNEGPDMGGYICLCTVVQADLWKIGQLAPGNIMTVQFKRVSWKDARQIEQEVTKWLKSIKTQTDIWKEVGVDETKENPILFEAQITETMPRMVIRQAGDSAILVEYGEMKVDFEIRAHVHALETTLKKLKIPGVQAFCPCVRSTMIHYDPNILTQQSLVSKIQSLPRSSSQDLEGISFPGRRITFPIVLDDQWCKDAIAKYMATIRDSAVYLPSNLDYLAYNNGCDIEELLEKLTMSDWLVFGVGFYLACPFLIPIDPRCQIVAQKMNPSRTYTPRGAVGLAGMVAAIYPIVSPGGYMLYGRTLPAWQQWGQGQGNDFTPDRPWLLFPFDQVRFEPITKAEYIQLERKFDAGQYKFNIEETTFSIAEHKAFTASIANEIAMFTKKQQSGTMAAEARESQLLYEWEEKQKVQQQSIKEPEATAQAAYDASETLQITSPFFGNIWKICCQVDDIILSSETIMLILEAMKTEIPIKAGEGAIGKKVIGYGTSVRVGKSVIPGEVLVALGDHDLH